MKVCDQGHFFTFYLKLNDVFNSESHILYGVSMDRGKNVCLPNLDCHAHNAEKKTTSSESCSMASAIGFPAGT